MDTTTKEKQLILTKVPIHNRLLKLEPNKKRLRKTTQNCEFEYLNTDSSQSNDDTLTQLKEPEEKITLIERAIGYFNAENDLEAQKSALNVSTTEGPPYICKICHNWFYLGSKLKLHYLLNHNLYHCEVCSILFNSSDEKTDHLKKYHSPIFCEICQKFYTDLSTLLEHYKSDHDSTTCQFCGILLQPQSMAANHIIRKHCVFPKFFDTTKNIVEVIHNTNEFFCALCNKSREREIFFGHMNSHHKLSVGSLMNLMVKLEVKISVTGARKHDVEGERNEEKVYKNSCPVCLLRFTKKIPQEFHFIYCQSKIQCKFCEKQFSNPTYLDKHLTKQHTKFLCRQGCEKLAYNSESNLVKHYTKFHEAISCRYCHEYILTSNFERHLVSNHKYKAVIMKNFTDTLFEVTQKENKHIVICCLCDENISLLAEKIRDIFQHYNLIHKVNFIKILQMIGPKPMLEDYEDFYREINESIKKETDGMETGNKIRNEEENLAYIPEIKIKVEPLETLEFSENEESDQLDKNEPIKQKTDQLTDQMGKSDQLRDQLTEQITDIDQPEDELPEESGLSSEDERPAVKPRKFEDFSHLQSEIESDFDIEETEILINSDSELEDENKDFPCEFCYEKLPKLIDLIRHIQDKHKMRSKYRKYDCKYCSEVIISYKTHANHLLSHHGNKEFDFSKEMFTCDCHNYQVVHSLARSHVLKVHTEDLTKYNVEKIGLKCRFCEKRFWERNELNEHEIEAHFQENQLDFQKCFTCFAVFSSQKCLSAHSQSSHEDIPIYSNLIYKCLNCTTVYPNLSLLRDHFLNVHPTSKVFRCPVPECYKVCKREKYMLAHLKRPHEKGKEQNAACDVCGKRFKSFRAATIHKLMKHQRDRAGFQCRICNERFSTSEQRKLHYSTSHPGQLAYNCLECGKGFISKSGLYGHRKIHQQNSNLVCPYCSKEFSRRDSYNEHLLIHIGPRHQCPHCPKSFTQRSNLTRHVRIHTGAKPYQCCYCEKRFSDRGACRSHERVHTKEEHCQCSYCGKKFTKKQKLKYHIKFHTGEGLVTCETCGKQFSNTYSLNEHRKIHNQQTLVMCNCGRGFSSEKYLQRHIQNVHSDTPTTKYICPVCFKPLYHKSSYNDHIMTHSSVKHVRCLLCNKEYNTKKTVKRHIQEQHNLRKSEEIYKHIYQLTPLEAGLNLPTASEMAVNVTELLNDKNVLNLDVAKFQQLVSNSNQSTASVTKKSRSSSGTGAKIQIKEEPISDDSDENNDFSERDEDNDENSEDDVPLDSRAKRKAKKLKKNKKHQI